MNTSINVSSVSLLRLGFVVSVSAGLFFALLFSPLADVPLPGFAWAGLVAFSLSFVVLSAWVWNNERVRQEKEHTLSVSLRSLHLPKPALPDILAPKIPDDGGDTPTGAFLAVVFEHWTLNKSLPSVRAAVFAEHGLNAVQVQRMYTRLVSWRCVVGRVQGGASGSIAEGWSHGKARQWMLLERPDYFGSSVSVSKNGLLSGEKQTEDPD